MSKGIGTYSLDFDLRSLPYRDAISFKHEFRFLRCQKDWTRWVRDMMYRYRFKLRSIVGAIYTDGGGDSVESSVFGCRS